MEPSPWKEPIPPGAANSRGQSQQFSATKQLLTLTPVTFWGRLYSLDLFPYKLGKGRF